LLHEIAAAASEFAVSDAVKSVVVFGGEKAFAAGADISEFGDQAAAKRVGRAFRAAFDGLAAIPRPVIAAVNGFALGGGCELALACDFIYSSDQAKYGQPEVTLGVIPGFGGTQRLARRVGVAKAKQLCMTGEIIDAAEALRIGLVDAVVPHAELIGIVRALAGKIVKNGPLAVAEVKRLIHMGQSTTLEHALALEQRSFGLLFNTEDQREGMSAFLAKPKRKPGFQGK